MKIEYGKLKFEYRICWNCKGKKEVTRYKQCPNYNKKMYGKICIHCGSKNKHSHTTILKNPEYIITCPNCDGQGIKLENRCDDMTKTERINWLKNVTFKFVENQIKTFNDSYIGHGNLCGTTDYADHRQDRGIIEKIKNRLLNDTMLQYIGIIKEGKLADIVYCKGQRGGYTAIAGWSK